MDIALLQGGHSPERTISLKTGEAVRQALQELGHSVAILDTDKESLCRLLQNSFDFVFIALHGEGGEDGTIQGFLDTIEVPYNGPGVLASALCMNKLKTKECFLSNDLPTPEYLSFSENPIPFEQVKEALRLPFIFKPVSLGSTIGVNLVRTESEYRAAIADTCQYQQTILLERYIPGKEITVAVKGDMPLPVLEIETSAPMYDYESKYQVGAARHFIPPRLPSEVIERCAQLSVHAAAVTDCSGIVRVDARITEDQEVFLLEVNTLPGMTECSLVPECSEAAGISFTDLIDWIVQDGAQKKKKTAQV